MSAKVQEGAMNNDVPKIVALSLFIALVLAAPMVFAADGDKTTGRDVGRKIDETAQSIKNYSADQRDEALKNAKKVLEDADARIDEMESDMGRNWDKMSASARAHAQETMKKLRRQRQDLSQGYGELKRSSSSAWDEVRNGFSRSYDALRESFSRAAREF
jgi:hypothetical protein